MNKNKKLNNPRVRRMLDLLQHNNERKGDSSQPLVNTNNGQPHSNQPLVDINNGLRDVFIDITKSNNDDRPEYDKEFVTPKNNAVSTPSSISSFGGDSVRIDEFFNINNNKSPSTVSNLSLILNSDANFVASPSVIYKNLSNKNTPTRAEFPEIEIYNNTLCIEMNSSTQTSQRTEDISKYLNMTFIGTANDKVGDSEEIVVQRGHDIMFHEDPLSVQSNNQHRQDIKCLPMNDACKETFNETRNLYEEFQISHEIEIEEIDETIQEESNKGHNNIIIDAEDTSKTKQMSKAIQIENIHLINDNEQLNETTSQITDEINSDASIIEERNEIDQNIEKKRSRKRHRNENEWKDNKNKKLCNSGESYMNKRTKKLYPKKVLGPVCSCKKKCSEKFSTEQREKIFKNFYKIADHELQWQFICRHTKVQPIKKMTLDRKQNRTQTINYCLPLDGSEISVCKVFFLNTLKISDQFVYTALEKIKKDEGLIDKRGNHSNRPYKMNILTKNSVIDHIKLFPAIDSHYIRKDSIRQYLSEDLNISKMYRLYELWFLNQNLSEVQKATKRQYETVFNTEFNYSFFRPKKDQCATCSLYEQADEVRKLSLEDNYREHLKRKEQVRQIKNEEKSGIDVNTTIAVFDLEKVLSVPQSEVGIFHYKRKYAVYNFTVYDLLRKAGHCFVWHMSIAKRGSIEIGSCLLKFIQQEQLRGIENFSFYSDGCAGQNKNRYIFALYLYIIQVYGVKHITHRFFETGHSQNEGDNMHSCVERAMKNKVLFTPDQVYSVISNAKITGTKYKINEMEQTDFYDIKKLIDGRNWIKDTQGRKIKWSKVMECRVSHLKPNTLEFKYDFEKEPFELDTKPQVAKTTRGRKATPAEAIQTLNNLYSQPLPVTKALFEDLKSLCDSEAIPKHYHAFYQTLNVENTVSEPIDSDENDN